MKSMPINPLKLLTLALLSMLLIAQTGCSINAREFSWAAYNERDPAIDEWQKLSPSTDRTVLLATYASTEYTNPRKLASDAELISANTPVVLAWIEFKETEQPVPLYRYVIQPLKAITAEELLSQGKYIANDTFRINNLPARTPTKTTNGAVVTDWQYCYDCFTTKSLETLTPADIADVREKMKISIASKPLGRLLFINNPKQTTDFKSRASLAVYSGDEAVQQQARLVEHVGGLSGDIAEAKNYDKQYRQFTNTEHKPLTYGYWAEKAGCPKEIANSREISGDRRSQSNTIIRMNMDYIDCNSAVLENYDLAPYQAKYEHLYKRENMLWNRSSKTERHPVARPETMINNVLQSIDIAIEDIEYAYSEIELAEELDARNRQLEAFSQQNWANTLNSIQARNRSISAQYRQNQKMIRRAERSQREPPKKHGYVQSTQPSSRPTENSSDSSQSIPSAEPSSQTSATQSAGNSSSSDTSVTDTDLTGSAKAASISPENEKSEAKAKEPNRYVGSGRDYPFTGESGQFYNRELSVDLAETSLMNQASRFCGSGLKAEIRWSAQPNCKPSSSEQGNFKCSIDGLVNCYENNCEEPFCGTGR